MPAPNGRAGYQDEVRRRRPLNSVRASQLHTALLNFLIHPYTVQVVLYGVRVEESSERDISSVKGKCAPGSGHFDS